MAATETSAINAVSTINATVIFPLPDVGTVFFIVPVTDSLVILHLWGLHLIEQVLLMSQVVPYIW